MVEHAHGYRGDHRDFLCVVLEDEDHVEVLQVELHALKVNQLNVTQGNNEGRLQLNRMSDISCIRIVCSM